MTDNDGLEKRMAARPPGVAAAIRAAVPFAV
jgi:hypothetical protein